MAAADNIGSIEALRADWDDAPDLSDEQKAALRALPDSDLRAALDTELRQYEDLLISVLDHSRWAATRRLVEQLGNTRD